MPKLFIVKKDQALTAETITAYCRENLTGYKRPNIYRVQDRTAEDAGRQNPAAGAAGIVVFDPTDDGTRPSTRPWTRRKFIRANMRLVAVPSLAEIRL